MAPAKEGDTVKIHYTGKLEDGTVFDSSRDREPIEFTIGSQQVIPGFEEGAKGLEPGDSKTIEIPPDEAYGERRDELVATVGRSEFPENFEPEIGQRLQLQGEGGRALQVTVTGIGDEGITLDGNHPLAGHTLQFDIERVEG